MFFANTKKTEKQGENVISKSKEIFLKKVEKHLQLVIDTV